MELKGSRTEQNLRDAFTGESEARNKYTFFASEAKKAGYEQIAAIFQETADNEKEHAELWLKFLSVVQGTASNLVNAAAGEHYEWETMYYNFEKVAREEGFTTIADFFKEVGEVEAEHEKRYLALKKNIDDGTVFKKPQSIKWRCRNCGYIHEGPEAPQTCPACAHAQAYYEVAAFNY